MYGGVIGEPKKTISLRDTLVQSPQSPTQYRITNSILKKAVKKWENLSVVGRALYSNGHILPIFAIIYLFLITQSML
jgi:hypothetical protein